MRVIYDHNTDANYCTIDADYDGYEDDITPHDEDKYKFAKACAIWAGIGIFWFLVAYH